MSWPTQRNETKQYIVVDQDDKVIMYFRLKMAAKYWIQGNQHLYLDNKLRVIINDKV